MKITNITVLTLLLNSLSILANPVVSTDKNESLIDTDTMNKVLDYNNIVETIYSNDLSSEEIMNYISPAYNYVLQSSAIKNNINSQDELYLLEEQLSDKYENELQKYFPHEKRSRGTCTAFEAAKCVPSMVKISLCLKKVVTLDSEFISCVKSKGKKVYDCWKECGY